jgi:Flp pilus assembly protein CpaB
MPKVVCLSTLIPVVLLCAGCSKRAVEQALPKPSMVELPVARVDLRPGTIIEGEPELFFKRGESPADRLPSGCIVSLDALRNVVIVRPVKDGQFITKADVVDLGGLTRAGPPGTRATTIRFEPMHPSFVGNKVDVISASGDKEIVVVQDVLVLAINSVTEAKGTWALVTLALKPEQAEQVFKAAEDSKLLLVPHKKE